MNIMNYTAKFWLLTFLGITLLALASLLSAKVSSHQPENIGGHTMQTVSHDGHWFIVLSAQSQFNSARLDTFMLHHPDCPIQKCQVIGRR